MTNCNETLRDLYPYLDGELSDDVHAHVHAHIETCSDCFQAFDFEAELKMAIRRKCSNDELPASLVERLEACFQEDLDGDGAIGTDGSA